MNTKSEILTYMKENNIELSSEEILKLEFFPRTQISCVANLDLHLSGLQEVDCF